KHADILSTTGGYSETVLILEGLVLNPDAPFLVRLWLGYFLLFVPDRLCDAIEYSTQYFTLMDDPDCLFNIACAYAQAFCWGTGKGKPLGSPEENRMQALGYLSKALERNPGYLMNVKSLMENNECFACLAADKELLEIIHAYGAGDAADI